MSIYRERTLCWKCQNYSRCSWSRGKPVKGWVAEKTVVDDKRGYPIKSYKVHKCPEFIPDNVYYVTTEEIANIVGLEKQRTSHLLNRHREKVEKLLADKGFKLHSFEGEFGWYLENTQKCHTATETVDSREFVSG